MKTGGIIYLKHCLKKLLSELRKLHVGKENAHEISHLLDQNDQTRGGGELYS